MQSQGETLVSVSRGLFPCTGTYFALTSSPCPCSLKPYHHPSWSWTVGRSAQTCDAEGHVLRSKLGPAESLARQGDPATKVRSSPAGSTLRNPPQLCAVPGGAFHALIGTQYRKVRLVVLANGIVEF